MDINFNPATPEGQQQLQTEGVEVLSTVPYGGTDSDTEGTPDTDDEFIDGLFSAFGIGK